MIEHRRVRDGEVVGWMRPDGDGFVAIDLLGRPRSGPVDWCTAEELLDGLGLEHLAGPHELLLETGDWLRVRTTEVSPTSISVKGEVGGDISSEQVSFRVRLPVPLGRLRPLTRPAPTSP